MGKNTPDRQEFIINNLREDVDRESAEEPLEAAAT
jgi:hypothetical protein